MMIKKIAPGILAVLFVTQLSACANGSPPRQQMELTQTSIRSAEAAGAVDFASKPLRAAQQRVIKAQRLIDKKKYDEAKYHLQLAFADAELAEAQAEAKQTQKAEEELNESIELMKKEIARVQED